MIKVVVGLIFRNDGKEVLLCQRKPEMPYPHKWEFPGGKVNDGEETEECLKRELSEELQISVLQSEIYHRQSYEYASGTFDVHYFTVLSFNGEPHNHVFADMKWVPISELSKYDILAGNATAAQKLLNDDEKI